MINREASQEIDLVINREASQEIGLVINRETSQEIGPERDQMIQEGEDQIEVAVHVPTVVEDKESFGFCTLI